MIITTDAAEDNTYEYTFNSGTISELKSGYIYTIKIGLGESVLGSVDQIEGGNSPYEPGGDVDGNAEAVTPEIPGYMVVEAPADDADALASCLDGKRGAIALKFVAGNTYKADMITVPAGITDLLLIGKEGQAKVTMKGLDFESATLEKLTMQNLEIAGDANARFCNKQLATGAVITVSSCYIHDVKALYGEGAEIGGQNIVSSMTINDCMIYNSATILDKGTCESVILTNSTLYNFNGQAFHAYKGDSDLAEITTFEIENCTLVDMGDATIFQNTGGKAGALFLTFKNTIVLATCKNINWNVKQNSETIFENNYAVSDGACTSSLKSYDDGEYIMDVTNTRIMLFPNESNSTVLGGKDFSTSVDAGDPRWKK